MISLYDILEAANGQLFGEPAAQLFTDFSLDPLQVRETQLFIAYRTDKGDTHQSIEQAIRSGASGILCVTPPDCDTTGVSVLMVRDPEEALMQWAHFVLGKFGAKVIGVTGSTGKSVTVEVIGRILSSRYSVLVGNLDEDEALSLPRAMSHLNAEHQFVVLKLSIDYPGEMSRVVEAVRPSVGIITSVDYAHTAAFKDREQVAREMGHLLEYLSPTDLAILNYDDNYVREIASRLRANVITVGVDSFGADLMAFNTIIGPTGTGFDLRYGSERYIGRWIPLLSKESLYSVLMALMVGSFYGIPIDDGLKVLTDLSPLPGRMNPVAGINGILLIDDSYSASPSSTLSALDWLHAIDTDEQRSIFVMGDMDDLGAYSQLNHRLVGKRAAEVADVIITQGTEAAIIGRSALDHGMNSREIHMSYSPQDTIAILQSLNLNENDVILVKGGNHSRMEMVVQALLENTEDRSLLVRQDRAWDAAVLFENMRPNWVDIDTNALSSNVRAIREIIGSDIAMMAVVKSNAYGHGAVQVARTALLNGADYLAVASMPEAMELREAGITAPILVLSYTPTFAVRQAIQQNITISIFDLDLIRAYDRAAREAGGFLRVHVKIDTGMGRLGVPSQEAVGFFRHMSYLQHIDVEGVYTHFSAADEDPEYTAQQVEIFKGVLRPLRATGFHLKYIHAANSAGLLLSRDNFFNMVRPGLLLYGLLPGDRFARPGGLQAVMTWKTRVAQVRELPPGYPVGYGNTYRTRSSERIAILPVGYADGLRRSPKTWREVLIKGARAPLVGRVSMEKCAVNITHIQGVSIGDEVVLLGKQGDDEITADEIAGWLGTINYEVVTTIAAQTPR